MRALFNRTVDVLSGMLNYRSRRHQVLLSNIANLDVPEYRAAELTLKNVKEGNSSAMPPVSLKTTQRGHMPSRGMTSDGIIGDVELKTQEGKVSLDREMASVSENHLMYNATIEMLARKFRSLNTVLKETR
ncbi:MAG: flagellar basal body rod protein FlgB [Pseudomonadota bacterium]|nr:flagellar basal body rod protein FlgB [Pseudomonadota bacterium]